MRAQGLALLRIPSLKQTKQTENNDKDPPVQTHVNGYLPWAQETEHEPPLGRRFVGETVAHPPWKFATVFVGRGERAAEQGTGTQH